IASSSPPHFYLFMSTIPLFSSFNHTAPTEIYTLSLHDALPIFFELQSAFQSYRKIIGSPQIQEIRGISEQLCHIFNGFTVLQNLFYLTGNLIQLLYQPCSVLFLNCPAFLSQQDGHHRKHRHLRGKSFGGGYPNLGPSVGINSRIGIPCNGGPHYIA